MEIKHPFENAKADGPDDTLVQPSDWNDAHTFTLSATDVLVGRSTSGAGAAEEIPCTSTGRSLLAAASGAAVFALVKQAASDTVTGVVELATQAEAVAGASNAVVMTPLRSKQLIDAQASIMPVGAIMPYVGTSAPSGWLLCAGQLVSRSTYSALFTVAGTSYGAGDGSTTFGVPDLRGRVPAGQDDMGGTAASRLTSAGSGLAGATLGAAGGTETHTLTEEEMPLHGHPFRVSPTSGGPEGSGGMLLDSDADTSVDAWTGSASSTLGRQIGGSGGDDPHNNVQPTLVVNYIIYTGV